MGQALSWIAVKGLTDTGVAKALRLKKTGRQSDGDGALLLGRHLADGWYLVVANKCDDRIVGRKTLAQISRGCQALACSIEEHVMFSSCSLWSRGKQLWSVRHRGDRSALDVVQSGKPPEGYSSLKREFLEKQKSAGGADAEVDHVFELPLQLAKRFVGFKHDEQTPGPSYEILEPAFLERASRLIGSVKPWLYVAAAFPLVIVIIAFVAMLTREAVDWLFEALKNVVP